MQAGGPRPEDVALVIGCGTGYAWAILARVVNTVVAAESDPGWRHGKRLLGELGIDTGRLEAVTRAPGRPISHR